MTSAIAGKRLLIAEEALKDPVGHWYEYVKSVAELNRQQGVAVTTAGHGTLQPAIAHEIGGHALFVRSNWDGVYAHPQAWRRYLGIFQHNWLVYRTMSRFITTHGPFDCLFAPTVTMHHILGWRLLMLTHGKQIGRMVLLFRNNLAGYAPGSSVPIFKRSALMMRWALRSFSGAIASGKVGLATDSTRLASEYRVLSGIAPTVYPSPRVAPFADAPRPEKRADEPLVFSSLGPARFEKGIDLLQAAITDCLAKGLPRPVKFVIQWNQPIDDAEGKPYLPDPALLADPRVEFITQAMSSEQYDAAISASDCLLLPYQRLSYFARISGVAVEAATAGIPMIYTADTWTADLAESCGAGIAIDDGDTGSLERAICEMAGNYAHYSDVACERRKGAQLAHSSDAFMRLLWDDPC